MQIKIFNQYVYSFEMGYERANEFVQALLDGWVRRKIWEVIWRQWKRPYTLYKRLMALGPKTKLARQTAYYGDSSEMRRKVVSQEVCHRTHHLYRDPLHILKN